MTTTSTIRLDDDLIGRLYGAISEFLLQSVRPVDTDQLAQNVKTNLQHATSSLAANDTRSEEHALRSALSGLGFIESDIRVRMFLSNLRYTLRRDMDLMQTEHIPFRLMCSLVAHVGDLLRQIDRYPEHNHGDGTFRLDAEWGNPRIEVELYRLRARLHDILTPRESA